MTIVYACPDHAFQHTIALSVTLEGAGFMPGARARLERDDAVIEAVSRTVESSSKMGAAFSLLGTEPGSYDVVVSCPDGREARLENGFTVVSPCGQGSGFSCRSWGFPWAACAWRGCGGAVIADIRDSRGEARC
ncbi:MAG: hypothetical protein ACUVS1_03485 [Actinomycetota bacterium]